MIRYLFRRLFYFSLFFILVFIISNTSFVEASTGVTSFYTDKYPLILQPGDVEDIFFILHNVPPGEEIGIDVVIELSSEKEIAVLTEGMMYHVPFGQKIKVPARIVIPKRAKAGTEYKVSVLVKPSSSSGGGNIGFTTSIGSSFLVVVKDPGQALVEKSPSVGDIGGILFWGIFVILISLIIVVFFLIIYLVRKQGMTQIYELQGNVAASKF